MYSLLKDSKIDNPASKKKQRYNEERGKNRTTIPILNDKSTFLDEDSAIMHVVKPKFKKYVSVVSRMIENIQDKEFKDDPEY